MRLRQVATATAVLMFAPLSLACSPAPMKLKAGPNGLEPEGKYVFVGQVVGEGPISAKSSKGNVRVTALRVRVIDSSNQHTSPGTVHHIYQWTMEGSGCEYRGPKPLTTADFPIGTKIRVIADDSAIPFWELRDRVLRVQ